MNEVQARVSEGGRIVIPADFRRQLNIQEGDLIHIRLEDGAVRVTPARTALHRACELTAQHVSPQRSLADELVTERRQETQDV